MLKHPVVITSLAEDLRELGLDDGKSIAEDTAAPQESAATDPVVTPPAPAVEGAAAAPAAPVAEPAPAATKDEVEEGRRVRTQVRVVGGKAKRVRTKRTSMSKKIANRQYARSHKSQLKRRAKKAGVMRRAARRDKIRSRLKREGFDDRVANLMESVKDLLTQVKDGTVEVQKAPEMAEATKTFANLAIISEMLADAFMAFAEDADEFDLSKFEIVALQEMAATYAQVAEDCAEIAETLDKGGLTEDDKASVEEAFKAHMQTVLDGIEAFADLTEDDDEDDDEDEDMCDDCGKAEEDCGCSGK